MTVGRSWSLGLRTAGWAVAVWAPAAAAVVERPEPGTWVYTDARVELRLHARTPSQMRAFYEARGFPAAAINAIAQTCFITVGIRNVQYDVLWLEPSAWRFVGSGGGVVERFGAEYWQRKWDELGVPPANRATFRWTQLPEQRDLRRDEPVGGNLTLARSTQHFTVEAHFSVGADRARAVTITIPDVRCADDVERP